MTAALLVGGDRDVAKMMRMVLEDEGYAIAKADTGDLAVTVLRQRAQPAVVVLLTTRPFANELAVLEAAEMDPAIGRHAFVLVTSESCPLPARWEELVEALSVPVVTMPFRLAVLLRTLQDANTRLLIENAGSAR